MERHLHRFTQLTPLVILAAFLVFPARGNTPEPWRWPTKEPQIVVEDFAPPAFRWLAGHRGVDVACSPECTIYAPASGRVNIAGRVVDRGVVVIQHDLRRSTFEPVIPLVKAGDYVTQGTPIATLAPEGQGVVKWGVKVDSGSYLNPLEQLIGRIILKPWE